MQRTVSACVLAAHLAAAEDFNPYVDNLLVDGQLRFEQEGQGKKTSRVYLKTPRYWTLDTGAKQLKGHDLPFDRQVKVVGDCSI